ncbi:hypothetical protein LIS04_13 [Listeria phage LIS04]|nr:hypothetical protein LIS04_13 [Listeria phage LIS04]
MSFVRRHNSNSLNDFIRTNLEVLNSPEFDDSRIQGIIDVSSRGQADSICQEIDNLISSLNKIKNEVRAEGSIDESAVSSSITYSPASAKTESSDSELLAPRKGEKYRSSLSEAIKMTNTPSGLS